MSTLNQHIKAEYPESELTARIIRCFRIAYDAMGYGFLESNYSGALGLVMNAEGLQFAREVPIDVTFWGQTVGHYRFDLLVEQRVLVELKATAALTVADERQVRNYLRATGLQVGLLLHFGPSPKVRRFINTHK